MFTLNETENDFCSETDKVVVGNFTSLTAEIVLGLVQCEHTTNHTRMGGPLHHVGRYPLVLFWGGRGDSLFYRGLPQIHHRRQIALIQWEFLTDCVCSMTGGYIFSLSVSSHLGGGYLSSQVWTGGTYPRLGGTYLPRSGVGT